MEKFYKKINEEVFYPAQDIVALDASCLAFLKQQAMANPRRRARFCSHQDIQDKVHEMFIVHTRDTYVRPHKHLKRIESMYLMEGEVDLILFDDTGKVTDIMEMGPSASGKSFYYRIAQPIYHALRIKSGIVCFHEVINGPFDLSDTAFPSWAPDGQDQKLAMDFIGSIQQGKNRHAF
jgi:cupin fold WbuC family metalloprotein